MLPRFTQASKVKFCNGRLVGWPTRHAVPVAVKYKSLTHLARPKRSVSLPIVPLFLPTMSLVLPSPGHQLTNPEGGGSAGTERSYRQKRIGTGHSAKSIGNDHRIISRIGWLHVRQSQCRIGRPRHVVAVQLPLVTQRRRARRRYAKSHASPAARHAKWLHRDQGWQIVALAHATSIVNGQDFRRRQNARL